MDDVPDPETEQRWAAFDCVVAAAVVILIVAQLVGAVLFARWTVRAIPDNRRASVSQVILTADQVQALRDKFATALASQDEATQAKTDADAAHLAMTQAQAHAATADAAEDAAATKAGDDLSDFDAYLNSLLPAPTVPVVTSP